jgi:hypothetical protein
VNDQAPIAEKDAGLIDVARLSRREREARVTRLILARHADPRTTEHYDRARGNLDRHGVHFLTAYVAGV